MRGKGSRITKAGVRIGITPAYAGKSITLVDGPGWNEDHPRLCGEKKMSEIKIEPCPGSPPPMRGKALQKPKRANCSRITPAYAGKSESFNDILYTLRDHPRLCGEKKSFRGKLQSRLGSPPPMRGKDTGIRLFYHVIRITPAYAGKRF